MNFPSSSSSARMSLPEKVRRSSFLTFENVRRFMFWTFGEDVIIFSLMFLSSNTLLSIADLSEDNEAPNNLLLTLLEVLDKELLVLTITVVKNSQEL